MGSDTIAAVVIAVCGAVGGLASVLQSRRAGSTAAAVQHGAELTISPALHLEYTARLEASAQRESLLQELLRLALRLIRRQNRRLAAAGLDPEPVPDELIPYSIS